MKFTLLPLLAIAPAALAAPIPVAPRDAAPGYGNYGTYAPPAGGYGKYEKYGKYGSYGKYPREEKVEEPEKRADYGSCKLRLNIKHPGAFSNFLISRWRLWHLCTRPNSRCPSSSRRLWFVWRLQGSSCSCTCCCSNTSPGSRLWLWKLWYL